MGIRERIRKGVRERARKGRRERSTDTRVSGKRRRQLAKVKRMIAEADGANVSREDDEARNQFERAERTAAAGPVFNATLDPSATPEHVEGLASGNDPRREREAGLSVGSLVGGQPDASEGTMEGLVLGDGKPDDRDDDGASSLEEMATGGLAMDEEDDEDSFFWGDD